MKKVMLAAGAVALTFGGLVPLGLSPAAAAPATTAAASGYGLNIDLAGTPLIETAGLATATLPPGEVDGPNSLLLVPVAPVVVNGTAVGLAGAHTASDLSSTLEQVQQAEPGPYNAVGVGLTDGASVLFGTPSPVPGLPDVGVELLTADAVRAEAVGVCRNGVAQYSANSEIVDLNIGGTDVPLNAPITDLVDTLNTLLQPLAAVVDIERNEVVDTPTGAAVNALHVTVLGLGGAPLADVVIGHAEVGGLTCPDLAQCSDTEDNDGDGVIDAQDPGCLTPDGTYNPNDDDERNECTDTVDNDGDGLVDFGTDPGCTDAQDDDERDPGGQLPETAGGALARTGGDFSDSAPLAMGMAVLAFGALALRRRSRV
jgi:LPXTG-motif cell wall-anchored protein